MKDTPLDTFPTTFRDVSTIPFPVHTTVEGIHEKSLSREKSAISLLQKQQRQ